MPNAEFLNLADAARYGGFPTVSALQQYVYRFNAAHPEQQRIIRRFGRVHFETFAAALKADTFTRSDPDKPKRGALAVHA